jgi:hypothetical protein
MSTAYKTEVLIVGKGSLADLSLQTQAFVSNIAIALWANASVYALNNVVEYNSSIWRSLSAGNTGNTPSQGSTFWVLITPNVTDGDVAFIVSGVNSDIALRKGGVWVSLSGSPFELTLPISTSNYNWLSLATSSFTKLFFNYSITRGTETKVGSFNVAINSTASQLSEYAVNQIGGDVGVVFDCQIVSGNLQLLATTDSQSTAPTLEYTLTGWN